MHKRLYILLLLVSFNSLGQDFRIIEPDTVKNTKDFLGSFMRGAYELFEYQYYVVGHKHGLRLHVFNPNEEEIYESETYSDSYTHSLTFFISDSSDCIIVLGHNSSEYSWGNHLYTLENGKFEHHGLLDVATYDSGDQPWDVSQSTQIKILENGNLKFTFDFDSLMYNAGGHEEQILSNDQIYYIFNGAELLEKKSR